MGDQTLEDLVLFRVRYIPPNQAIKMKRYGTNRSIDPPQGVQTPDYRRGLGIRGCGMVEARHSNTR